MNSNCYFATRKLAVPIKFQNFVSHDNSKTHIASYTEMSLNKTHPGGDNTSWSCLRFIGICTKLCRCMIEATGYIPMYICRHVCTLSVPRVELVTMQHRRGSNNQYSVQRHWTHQFVFGLELTNTTQILDNYYMYLSFVNK